MLNAMKFYYTHRSRIPRAILEAGGDSEVSGVDFLLVGTPWKTNNMDPKNDDFRWESPGFQWLILRCEMLFFWGE